MPSTDRALVGAMLSAVQWIDIVVPRGGRSLIERVTAESRVPVLKHYDGLCHVYVDKDADKTMAVEIVANAKMRRTGVCGAAETLLIDRPVLHSHLPAILDRLIELGCEIRGDVAVQKLDRRALPATEKDWRTEYLAPIISVAVVDGVDAAIAHIERYGSQHTEAIVTANEKTAEHFLARVDSAIVLHNASTQYRRWRRVRHGGGDRHFDQSPACARAGRPGRADDLQECGARQRPDSPLIRSPPAAMLKPPGLGIDARRRIGLLGGSFNPAHEGHRHVSLLALQKLKLDEIWWLVSPQNPLKPRNDMAPLKDRLRAGAQDRRPRPAHQGHRHRNHAGHALHRRHDRSPAAAVPAPAFRLADGRRQSGANLALGPLAEHFPGGADCRFRPPCLFSFRLERQGGATLRRSSALQRNGRVR